MRTKPSGPMGSIKKQCPVIKSAQPFTFRSCCHTAMRGLDSQLLAVGKRPDTELKSSGDRFTSIFQLGLELDSIAGQDRAHFEALDRVLKITLGTAICSSTAELKQKFGSERDNQQLVVCVTAERTGLQVWWNKARTKKPQTFKRATDTLTDPTADGGGCDFCNWKSLTATDTFGRIENASCVTASNLFKFAFPCHGLVLFKHHNPLEFSADQIQDLLSSSAEWFRQARQAHPSAQWPLFLWNCLPRAGASQFHGHAQLTLTETPTPSAQTLSETLDHFPGGDYCSTLKQAYSSVGLLRSLQKGKARAVCFAELAPTKDMEITILGESLECPAFAALFHGACRALIEKLGMVTFNAGILNVSPGLTRDAQKQPIFARIVSRGSLTSQASDFGGLEVFGRASIGHTDPYTVIQALDSYMESHQGFSVA